MSNEQREWTWIDRKALGWPSGEWDSEPDKVHWKDDATGMDCLAVSHPSSGHWCGYVGVIEGHPAFGKGYDDVCVLDSDGEPDSPSVHWGLTFADECQDTAGPDRGVCHVPYPGDPDRVWWLGFDCAHSGDYSPQDAKYAEDRSDWLWRIDAGQQYRTLAFVKGQCRTLAAQLAQVSP